MIVYLQLWQERRRGEGGDRGPDWPLTSPCISHFVPLMLIGDPRIDRLALAGLTPRLSITSIMALSETSVRIWKHFIYFS